MDGVTPEEAIAIVTDTAGNILWPLLLLQLKVTSFPTRDYKVSININLNRLFSRCFWDKLKNGLSRFTDSKISLPISIDLQRIETLLNWTL
eukprot:TRINITY_DN15367_c0_g1_i2.p1 TRINITY_DN15367_c0_g1~~TRINITY_DN15367_c0_g1_i2.p1  ORF type:complete len:106 (+),score=25.52 TRINITY_DN15367_c0_g1_i2:48-320(+)